MTIPTQIAILIILFVPSIDVFSYLYRQRGADNKDKWTFQSKLLPIITLGIVSYIFTSFRMYNSNNDIPIWVYLLGLVVEILNWIILCKPSWGEIFPWDVDTHKEKFPPFVRPVTDWIVGFKYNDLTANDSSSESLWKIVAWIPRMGIYGTPLALLKCAAAQSFLPLAIWIMAAAYIGLIYRRNFLKYRWSSEDWIAPSEKTVGAFLGGVIIMMALP